MATEASNFMAVFGADISDFMRGASAVDSKLTNLAKSAGKNMKDLGGAFKDLGTPIAAVGVTATAAFGYAVKAAMDFESAFAGVIKTVDGSVDQLNELRNVIRDMATDATNPLAGLDDAQVTLAKIMELGGQLGVPIENLAGFTQVIGELTLSTDLSAESAAMMLAQFASVTGMPFEDFDRLGSVIVDLGNNMATTESQIVEFMQRLAGAGASFGFTQAQIAGMSAAMASVGLNAEAGGTAMTTVFTEMSGAVVAGGEKLQAFATASGLSASAFADAWNNEPIAALTYFITNLGEMDAAARELTLSQLGLDGIRVADTLRRLSNDSHGFAEALGIANIAWEENSALTAEAQKRFQTTEAQMNLLKNTVNDLAIEVGSALLPAFNDILQAVRPFIGQITELIRENPNLARGLAIAAIAVAGLGTALVAAGIALSAIGTAITAVVTILGSPFLLPIIAVTVAVAALAAAFYYDLGGIRTWAEENLGPVIDLISGLGAAISSFPGFDIFASANVDTSGIESDVDTALDGLFINENGAFRTIGTKVDIVVEPGDTVWGLSQELNIEQDALMELFGITDPRQLRPGVYAMDTQVQHKVSIEPEVEVTEYKQGFDFGAVSEFAREAGEFLREGIMSMGGITPTGMMVNASFSLDPASVLGFVTGMVTTMQTALAAYDIFDTLIGQPFREGFYGFDPNEAVNMMMIAVQSAIQSQAIAVWIAVMEFGTGIITGIQTGVINAVPAARSAIEGAILGLIPSQLNISIPQISEATLMSIGGSLLTGNVNIPVGIVGSIVGGISGGQATGGNVAGNMPVLVGEHGPEIFTPGMAGNITPNFALHNAARGGTGGGGQQTVNQYYIISASDYGDVMRKVDREKKLASGTVGGKFSK